MKQKQEKLETKMKWMLLSTMIPMTILIIVLLVFFWHYTNEYNQLSNNLAVSSEYNANYRNSNNDMSFKDEVDMDIYYVTIGREKGVRLVLQVRQLRAVWTATRRSFWILASQP